MLSDLLTAVQAKLAPIAKSVNGEQALAQHHAPPRYAFLRKRFAGRGPTSIGNNPRSLRDRVYTLEVHCWGKSYDEADRLTLALETALRIVCQGRNYSLDAGEFLELEDVRQGVVCVCTVEIAVTTPVVKLEAGAPDGARPAVTIESVEVEKPAGTPGDGEIEPGDD